MNQQRSAMPALTLKNIPDDLYEVLKRTAEQHRRSINSEILFCLEQSLRPKLVLPADRLEKIKAMRAGFGKKSVSPAAIRKAIRSGRP